MNESESDLLNRVYIETPCTVGWDTMQGDDRTRFCGQCSLNVYNVASLSSREAAALIKEADGRLCLRLYRRPDGTVITDNCPVGLKKMRDRVRLRVAAIFAFLLCIGWITDAHAQGLVGAPVDPGRCALSNEIVENQFRTLPALSSVAAVAWILVSRQRSIAIIGLGLSVIFVLAGLFSDVRSPLGYGL
jgi:hypothetical protein